MRLSVKFPVGGLIYKLFLNIVQFYYNFYSFTTTLRNKSIHYNAENIFKVERCPLFALFFFLNIIFIYLLQTARTLSIKEPINSNARKQLKRRELALLLKVSLMS